MSARGVLVRGLILMYVYHGWDLPYWAFLKIGVFEKLKKVEDFKKPAFWTGVKFFPILKIFAYFNDEV